MIAAIIQKKRVESVGFVIVKLCQISIFGYYLARYKIYNLPHFGAKKNKYFLMAVTNQLLLNDLFT